MHVSTQVHSVSLYSQYKPFIDSDIRTVIMSSKEALNRTFNLRCLRTATLANAVTGASCYNGGPCRGPM